MSQVLELGTPPWEKKTWGKKKKTACKLKGLIGPQLTHKNIASMRETCGVCLAKIFTL